MKRGLIFSFFCLMAITISAQSDYELLIKTADEVRNKNPERALKYYNKAIEINPDGIEAIWGIARCNIDMAPLVYSHKKEERDSLFRVGLKSLKELYILDTASLTKYKLFTLDAYNKNLTRGYEGVYNDEQILAFFADADNIFEETQKRYDYNDYKDLFDRIYEMLVRKKEGYRVRKLMN